MGARRKPLRDCPAGVSYIHAARRPRKTNQPFVHMSDLKHPVFAVDGSHERVINPAVVRRHSGVTRTNTHHLCLSSFHDPHRFEKYVPHVMFPPVTYICIPINRLLSYRPRCQVYIRQRKCVPPLLVEEVVDCVVTHTLFFPVPLLLANAKPA